MGLGYNYAWTIVIGLLGWALGSAASIHIDGGNFPVPPHTNKTLFYVQRSTNSNTVIYDVNLRPDKTIDSDDPVTVYWIRYAEKGQKKKLNYIERVLAYGVNCKPYRDNSVMLHFNASESKEVIVTIDPKGQARAQMAISKRKSYLEKIFVTVTEGGWRFPKVNYVEFFGTDLAKGEKTYEKMNI
jgi:hypothetical protein